MTTGMPLTWDDLAQQTLARQFPAPPSSVSTVAEVAEHFFYSREYVSRLFKKYLNTTVANYVLQRRIVYSQRLIETDMPLLDVCYQAGFGSTSSFIRAFQSVTGMTPSKYRHAHHERLKPSGG